MEKKLILMGLALFIFLSLAGCWNNKERPGTKNEPVNLTISAAASLRNAMEELKTIYTREHAGVTIKYNFASSGTLQRQIEEGAPVDLYISAGKSQMDALAEKNLIVDNSRKNLLENELVLISGKESSLNGFEDLTGANVTKISICVPESSPAGEYAKETLTALKLYDKIQQKLVLAKDVRQVLTYVETGNVDAGMVYLSDAATSKNIKIIATAPAGSHKQIVYPMAVIKGTKHQKEIEEFANFLLTDEAAGVFEKYGFKTIKN